MKGRLALAASVVAAAVLAFAGVGHATNGGSLSFNGSNQYVSVAGSSDWAVGTGDFTVEWFQYQTSFSSSWPRIFTVGGYPSTSIGVSIEGGTMYVWLAGAPPRLSVSVGSISNQWVHFAITRAGTTLRIYKNGTLLASGSNSSNVTDSSTPLYVGSEATSGTYFGGLITNFHFVKGTALYTAAFTPSGPITPVANTKLLLRATDAAGLLTDSGPVGRTVTNVNSTVFNWGTPFPWTGSITPTSVPATSPPATTSTTTTTTTTTTVAPTTTSTVTPTTTSVSTSVPAATTTSIASSSSGTVPPAVTPVTTAPVGAVTVTTVATGPTTTTRPATTTTRPADATAGSAAPTTTFAPTTTTSTTTTTTIPAPDAPLVDAGEVAATVDGTPVDADLQRVNNELVVTAGKTKVVLGAIDDDGASKGLSGAGSLQLGVGEAINVRVEGLEPDTDSQFWLFSEPLLIGAAEANDAGRLAAEAVIPSGVEPGEHRFVLVSTNVDGDPLNLSVGIRVQTTDTGGIRWGILLSLVVLGGGGLIALFLPAVLRRRAA